MHERTALCKNQLETIVENPGNTREGGGGGTSFWSLVRRQRTIPGLNSSVTQAIRGEDVTIIIHVS